MIQLPDAAYEAIQHLLGSSKEIHTSLVNSPLWPILRDEPVIIKWMNSLAAMEKLVIPQEDKSHGESITQT